ncbi:alpha-1,3/1,6-mannosyltransferase ALG2, partial [Thamnocephalis sphaerospora]
LGGAERLVVDAAVGLQGAGHQVVVYTSHHDRTHCFEETRDGTLDVRVYGDFLPRAIFGRFMVLCAIIRGIYLAFVVTLLGKVRCTDVVFCDQLSAWIPILKRAGARVFFYCHFPDLMLTDRRGLLKQLYRMPMDWFEEWTTGKQAPCSMADRIVVNSKFTASVFARAFTSASVQPDVLYPGIRLDAYDRPVDPSEPTLTPLKTDRITIVSINRFERKKNIALAIRCFAHLRDARLVPEKEFGHLRLIIAGGYDKRVRENVEHLDELRQRAENEFGLVTHTIQDRTAPSPAEAQVVFLPSFDEAQRGYLLATSRCLLYTPSGEHFGIVPIEAMYARLPVVAVADGGPTETVCDGETGYLCQPEPAAFAEAVCKLLVSADPETPTAAEKAAHMGDRGREWVRDNFTLAAFVHRLDAMLKTLAAQPARTEQSMLAPLAGILLVLAGLLVLPVVVSVYARAWILGM